MVCKVQGTRKTCASVSHPTASSHAPDHAALALRIRALAREAGFQRCGIAAIELGEDEQHLRNWLANGLYGSMEWRARHGDQPSRTAGLDPGTLPVIPVGPGYGRHHASRPPTRPGNTAGKGKG